MSEPDTHTGAMAWWFLDTLVIQHEMTGGGTTVVLEMTLPLGAAPPLHIHRSFDDSFYVLSGHMVVRRGGALGLVGPGDWVSTPRGCAHAFRVVGEEAARILFVSDSDSFVRLVRDLGQPAGAHLLPPPGLGPAGGDVSASLARHDVAVIGEPLSRLEAEAFLTAR